jgi:hypothetical protein
VPMLAELVDAVVGVDTHRDTHEVELPPRHGQDQMAPGLTERWEKDTMACAAVTAPIPRAVPADETPHPARGHIQAEPVVGPAQRVPQMLGLGRGDRQRLPLRPPVTEVEGVLGARAAAAGPPPSTPPPPPASARPDVLNLAGTTPVRVHDLHRGRPTRGLHRPHIGRPDRLKTSEQYKWLFGQY